MNLTFHEGLLILIYEYFKAQTVGKQIKKRKESVEGIEELEDSGDEYILFDMEDSLDMHSNLEEVAATHTKKGKKKIRELSFVLEFLTI